MTPSFTTVRRFVWLRLTSSAAIVMGLFATLSPMPSRACGDGWFGFGGYDYYDSYFYDSYYYYDYDGFGYFGGFGGYWSLGWDRGELVDSGISGPYNYLVYQGAQGSEVWISGCPETTTGVVEIPARIDGLPVVGIDDEAFSSCQLLSRVVIPEGVRYIGEFAFSGCASLTSVSIPDTVTDIGGGAFLGCTALVGVSIPAGVTELVSYTWTYDESYGVFEGCSRLRTVAIKGDLSTIEYYTFLGCDSLTELLFLGSAPEAVDEDFSSVGPGFAVYRVEGEAGSDPGTWQGMPTVVIAADELPAAAWLAEHGLSSKTDLNQDLNGDGVDLIMAYALNLDPANPRPGMPRARIWSHTMSIAFHGSAPGITYRPETSTDMVNWTTEGVSLSEPDPAGRRTAIVTRDGPRRFLRLVVERNGP